MTGLFVTRVERCRPAANCCRAQASLIPVLRLGADVLAGDCLGEDKIVAPAEFWLKGRDAYATVFNRQG